MKLAIVYSYFMPACSIVKTITRGAMDDLVHYCTRLKPEYNI